VTQALNEVGIKWGWVYLPLQLIGGLGECCKWNPRWKWIWCIFVLTTTLVDQGCGQPWLTRVVVKFSDLFWIWWYIWCRWGQFGVSGCFTE